MSDTEEIVIKRLPKNTKPEIAREKLKEKRLRLKKEKEDVLIEEAKKRLAQEQIQEQEAKAQEEQKKMSDPTYLLMSKFDAMMAMLSSKEAKPQEPEPVPEKKTRKPRAKAEPKEPKPKAPKPSPKAPVRRKKTIYQAEESPSNIFIGDDVAPPQEPIQLYNPRDAQINPLLAHLAGRRNMNSQYY
jgi:LPS O-antigen subunit length determinant protein (WzzB/FepE family)